MTDVDLDVAKRAAALAAIPEARRASTVREDKLVAHPSGVYLQAIPLDAVTQLAAYPYEFAEEQGYFKLDLLSNSVYDRVRDPAHLDQLLASPTDWTWFEDSQFVSSLFHLQNKAFLDGEVVPIGEVVAAYAPKSIDDLAMLIAIKLPAKKHLIGLDFGKIRELIWVKDPDGRPQFKKSHAFAYAHVVLLDAKLKKEIEHDRLRTEGDLPQGVVGRQGLSSRFASHDLGEESPQGDEEGRTDS